MGTGPVARPDPTPWAGKPTAAAPTWQENILQKVVMTAFADRTVVTIAVRGPLMGCRGDTRREGWPPEAIISGQPLGSPAPGIKRDTSEHTAQPGIRKCRECQDETKLMECLWVKFHQKSKRRGKEHTEDWRQGAHPGGSQPQPRTHNNL